MKDLKNCPSCKASLVAGPIPQASIDAGYYSAEDPFFYHTIGVYDLNTDRTVKWRCPFCSHEWDRK